MSNAALKIFIRVVKRRMEQGESLDEILAGYPKLTADEIEQIRQAVGGGD